MKEQNTTNNIIEKENKTILKTEYDLRDLLSPIISAAVSEGFVQKDLQKIVRELWQENNIKNHNSHVISNTSLELEITEEVFRKKAKNFIKKYGGFFIFLTLENELFFENLFWSMYLSATIKHSLKMEDVIRIFLGNHYKYNRFSDLTGANIYEKILFSLLDNLYVDKESNCLFLEPLPNTVSIVESPQYLALDQLLTFRKHSSYSQFSLVALTCIINFV